MILVPCLTQNAWPVHMLNVILKCLPSFTTCLISTGAIHLRLEKSFTYYETHYYRLNLWIQSEMLYKYSRKGMAEGSCFASSWRSTVVCHYKTVVEWTLKRLHLIACLQQGFLSWFQNRKEDGFTSALQSPVLTQVSFQWRASVDRQRPSPLNRSMLGNALGRARFLNYCTHGLAFELFHHV